MWRECGCAWHEERKRWREGKRQKGEGEISALTSFIVLAFFFTGGVKSVFFLRPYNVYVVHVSHIDHVQAKACCPIQLLHYRATPGVQKLKSTQSRGWFSATADPSCAALCKGITIRGSRADEHKDLEYLTGTPVCLFT